jgi:prepilin-type N-terminal cleavage/methylation domain-containing protein
MRDRGFALLEVIVAAALLAVLAAGMARIVAAAVHEGRSSRLRAIATVAAADKLEELRSGSPADAAAGTDYLDAAGAAVGAGGAALPSTVYTRQWMVQPLDGDPDVVALRVDVFLQGGALAARLITVRAAR